MSNVLPQNSRAWWVVLLLVYIAVAGLFAEWSSMPPPVRAEDPRDEEFSAVRAREHLRRVAQRPHPTGTAANAAVRDYLIQTLRQTGLEVESKRELIVNGYGRPPDARFAKIENIVAELPGSEPGKALLLMAHYDSVAGAPGAGDDGSGVVTILETLRHLARAPQRRNDVLVLLSDGEEIGLLGAQAFFNHHPRAKDVGQVLNFEGRGSRGPSLMFETSAGNGNLIDALSSVVPHPIASSLTYSVYKRMPNDTDLSIAKKSAAPAMNFAFGHGLFDYHSPTDTPERMSLATLQQQGDAALRLSRHFAAAELPVPVAPDRRYFNPVGRWFASYAGWVDSAVLVAAIGLIGFALVRSRRAGAVRIGQVLRGSVLALVALLAPVLAIFALRSLLVGDFDIVATGMGITARARWWLLGWCLFGVGLGIWLFARSQRGFGWLAALGLVVPFATLALIGSLGWMPVLAASVLVVALIGLVLRRPIDDEAAIFGALLLLVLQGVAMACFVQGGAHLFAWPLLAVALLHAWRWRGDGRAAMPVWFVAALPAALLFGFYAMLLDVMLGTEMPVAAVLLFLMVLLFLVPVALQDRRGLVGALACAMGVVVLVVAAFRDPFDAEFPRPTELFLLADADRANSHWVTSDEELTPWHRRRLGTNPQPVTAIDYLPATGTVVRGVPVDLAPTARPILELRGDREDGAGRHLRLALRVQGGTDYLNVFLAPATRLRGWSVDGQALALPEKPADQWWRLRAYALGTDTALLELDLAPGSPLPAVQLTSIHYGLPPGAQLPRRPSGLMRAPYTYSDSTVVSRRMHLQPLRNSD